MINIFIMQSSKKSKINLFEMQSSNNNGYLHHINFKHTYQNDQIFPTKQPELRKFLFSMQPSKIIQLSPTYKL